MPKYVKCNDVVDMLKATDCKDDTFTAIYTALHKLQKLPAPDVREVEHGHWEKHIGEYSKCSICKKRYNTMLTDLSVILFCPNCGARMDGDPK